MAEGDVMVAVTRDSLGDIPDGLPIAPDSVLPEQCIQGARKDSFVSGEKALMLAVLEDAIRCFQEPTRDTRQNPRLVSREAEAWIKADDWGWPFSFNNVCETLGIVPETLRASLVRWRAQRPTQRETPERPAPICRLHLRHKRATCRIAPGPGGGMRQQGRAG